MVGGTEGGKGPVGGTEGGKKGGRQRGTKGKGEGGKGEEGRERKHHFQIMHTIVTSHLLPQPCLLHSHAIEIHHTNTTVAISTVLRVGGCEV